MGTGYICVRIETEERSGWGHFYRYGRDGTFKNAITSGAWRASRIVEVDAKAGFVYLIGNSSRPGERVLDPFGGSGTTLIACEQTGRVGHLAELDPRYCDVIVRRWEKFTGRQGERVRAIEEANGPPLSVPVAARARS